MASELFPNGSLLQQVYFGSYFHAVPLRLPSCSRVAPFCHWSILALGAIREQLQSHKRTNIRFAEDWFLEFPIPFFHHGPINTHGRPKEWWTITFGQVFLRQYAISQVQFLSYDIILFQIKKLESIKNSCAMKRSHYRREPLGKLLYLSRFPCYVFHIGICHET